MVQVWDEKVDGVQVWGEKVDSAGWYRCGVRK